MQSTASEMCNVHQVMIWMEQCSYIAASRVGRGGHLLTGSMDSIAFANPTRVGDILYITAQVWFEAFWKRTQIPVWENFVFPCLPPHHFHSDIRVSGPCSCKHSCAQAHALGNQSDRSRRRTFPHCSVYRFSSRGILPAGIARRQASPTCDRPDLACCGPR